ncbi:hypothetical protein PPL_10982 [Heterostelium album PN500]|uniref:Uncharacterized protein n=1 Tax=Heterostelium pallidum (strain ATCC 26659 / Pp 5 / PN500) TaxID=670386 RepID=D3BSL3_HETP5|nr:hypothetical protein PPL_10982 [Heterostelium album PN500]EFA75478.1 hypothetical protein PPL_10982 [Heterostelium album PN500]|eukprot:XP_020427612.1 hypothetical protein PPL_10982 [Heterostelium album PN500]
MLSTNFCSRSMNSLESSSNLTLTSINLHEIIREKITTMEIDNNNNNNNNYNSIHNKISSLLDIQSAMESTFDSLKSMVNEYQQNQQTEDEISNRFKEIHEFLVVEEHKIKRPIININEQLVRHIESQTNVMKSLNTISQHYKAIFDSDHSNSQSNQSPSSSSISPDTTDRYQTSTIITSIAKCSNHNEFIQSNIDTLFCFNDRNNNKTKIDEYSLLNLFVEHNKTLNLNDIQHIQSKQYQLVVDDKQLELIKNQLQSTFKMVVKSQLHSTTHPPKQTYIFSTDTDSKLSMINITNRNNIHFEQQNIDSDKKMFYFYSVVTVGNYIYRFGSTDYAKYSIVDQTLTEIKMNDIDFGIRSVCYDGQDHIYIAPWSSPSIYRFNINQLKFEIYYRLEKLN